MKNNVGTFTSWRLNVETELVSEKFENFRLPSWPPPIDFPVVIDKKGDVICRYGDSVWDLSIWGRTPAVLNFGDGRNRKGTPPISKENADLLRMIVAWWLWGMSPMVATHTLVSQVIIFRKIFIECTREGVNAGELSRYPRLVDRIANQVSPNRKAWFLSLMHTLYENRGILGFSILDKNALAYIAKRNHQWEPSKQTCYVPPRIWNYQVTRLREVLDDFHLYVDQLEKCYHLLCQKYLDAYGHPLVLPRKSLRKNFSNRGDFQEIAMATGVDELLGKWYSSKVRSFTTLPIGALSKFMTLVNRAAFGYILNFSLMRVEEAWSLRIDCLHMEHDDLFGEIAMLWGETTKSVHDDDARWIVSPCAKVAIDALKIIGSWRVKFREACSEFLPKEDLRLIQEACEPWIGNPRRPRGGRIQYPSYGSVLEEHPKLFDIEQLRVTQEDWAIAKLLTPSIDESRFGVGKIWKLAWHQLRRTGAVNMQASGLVSNLSLQYELKHSSVASSLYYGQGYSRLPMNTGAKVEYVRALYECLGIELVELLSDRFISPFGPERKAQIVRLVSEGDLEKLCAASKSGAIAWRRTLLGGCSKVGPCEYGGVENIIRCGGGDNKAPCMDALFDRDRIKNIEILKTKITECLKIAESGSPYQQSLQAQLRSVENALNVLNL